MKLELRHAQPADLPAVDAFVGAYHRFEGIPAGSAAEAVRPLLGDNAFGRIWLIDVDGVPAGYVAVCFGYSIEFGGRDAFVDEFFLDEAFRGRGIGSAVLDLLPDAVAPFGVRALHLEVGRDNDRARRLYGARGFEARDGYLLMSRRLDGNG
ncbi:MAG: GNAT family N-acetyltransferase [Rhodothermales bacterium]